MDVELDPENVLRSGYLPELGGEFYRGKVRDNHIVSGKRIMVTTDRISAFDRILPALIPQKGAVLNELAVWAFRRTEDIVKNHLLDFPDPNVLVVREARPFPLEMVVRGYLTGSAWEEIAAGRFEERYGFPITPEMVEGRLERNCRLKEPIVTPTTKAAAGHDRPLTTAEARELVGEVYDKLASLALRLYRRGAELAAERGLILVDAKYEFGERDGEIILIDELHTPDSSRYWLAEEYRPGGEMVELSKQFVREIVRESELTAEQVLETARRYIALYERLTGERWEVDRLPVRQRMIHNLVKRGYIKGGFVQVIAGSERDDWFVEGLLAELERRGLPHGHAVYSAHKDTKELLDFIDLLNQSAEPLVAITVAGGSDALSGVVAHHLRFPVIACPPYRDRLDYLVNIHSLLQVPSATPVLVTTRPGNAAAAAERILRTATPSGFRS